VFLPKTKTKTKTKKFKLLSIIFIAVLGTVTTSCSSDDAAAAVPVAIANEVTYDGTTYALSKGFIQDYGDAGDNGNGSYDFDVFLTSSGLNRDLTTGGFTGSGQLLVLDLNSDSVAGLSSGTYNFSTTRTDFTLFSAVVIVDLDDTTMSGTPVFATGGSVVLTKDGTQYTIYVECTIASGDTISASYQGELPTIQ
jgi:hypothetical protein